jgi:HEAT repeat protein
VLYLSNLAKKGSAATAGPLANKLLDNAAKAGQVQTQTAALKVLITMHGTSSASLLIKAMKDGNAQYRAAALKMAGSKRLTPEDVTLWLQALAHADATRKAEIITMLGNNHAQAALPAITKELKNADPGVAVAAIKAAQQIGQDKSLDKLLPMLNGANAQELVAIHDALLVMKGSTVVPKVAKALPDAGPEAQVTLLTVLSARRAHDKIDVVKPLLNSSNSVVKETALISLQSLAGPEDLEQLFGLLSKSNSDSEITETQAAIISVISQMKDPDSESAMALQQMNNAPANRKSLYFSILAAIGDKASLAAVSKAYDNGDSDIQRAAVTALAGWANNSAIRELLHIGQSTKDPGVQNHVFNGLVKSIGQSDYPAEEKVIFLRAAMDIARTDDQRNQVLEELSNNKTYDALIFVGNFLDDPHLQTAASAAVVSIALSNKDFYGADVRTILNKVMAMRRGGDGDYEREAIKKFIAEMPSDEGYVDIFNNKDLAGWKGLVGNPITRSKMDEATLAKEQQKADSIMRKGWYVKDSVLNFSGEGENICTVKKYRNFDMYVDWKIEPKGDAGIYLRGSPQVQIWDTSRVDVGAQVGSGGLYNNQAHESKPLKLADNAIGEWNTFHIIMKDDKVTVYLNGVLVVDNVVLDNYWDRKLPIFPKEQIELQAHGTHVYYRDIYLKELPD